MKEMKQTICDIQGREILDSRGNPTVEATVTLENGGRGIGNIVGALLIDPLSRILFDNGIFSDARLEITEIDAQTAPACLECRRS